MRQKFSKHWKASRQPRKQRKYRANAPLHIKHKLMSANLNKDLRLKYRKRNFPIRKGDLVRVMRGEFRKKTGKISVIDQKRLRVAVEGLQKSKKDGTKVNIWFDPSNLQIKELNLDDKKRIKSIERKNPDKINKKENKNAPEKK